MKNQENKVSCPIDYAFHRIGGKHRAKILWFLNENKILRYGELKKLLSGITPKMLTQTLKELEADGMVLRKVYHQVPPKVEYKLTTEAEEIMPLINGLREWADYKMKESSLK